MSQVIRVQTEQELMNYLQQLVDGGVDCNEIQVLSKYHLHDACDRFNKIKFHDSEENIFDRVSTMFTNSEKEDRVYDNLESTTSDSDKIREAVEQGEIIIMLDNDKRMDFSDDETARREERENDRDKDLNPGAGALFGSHHAGNVEEDGGYVGEGRDNDINEGGNHVERRVVSADRTASNANVDDKLQSTRDRDRDNIPHDDDTLRGGAQADEKVEERHESKADELISEPNTNNEPREGVERDSVEDDSLAGNDPHLDENIDNRNVQDDAEHTLARAGHNLDNMSDNSRHEDSDLFDGTVTDRNHLDDNPEDHDRVDMSDRDVDDRPVTLDDRPLEEDIERFGNEDRNRDDYTDDFNRADGEVIDDIDRSPRDVDPVTEDNLQDNVEHREKIQDTNHVDRVDDGVDEDRRVSNIDEEPIDENIDYDGRDGDIEDHSNRLDDTVRADEAREDAFDHDKGRF